jgi:hypothetical protein
LCETDKEIEHYKLEWGGVAPPNRSSFLIFICMKKTNFLKMDAINCSPNANPIVIPKKYFDLFFKEKEYVKLSAVYALCCYLNNYEKLTKTDEIKKIIAKKLKWTLSDVEKCLIKLFELGCLS